MQTRNSVRSRNTSMKPVNKGATSTEKEKILEEIQELESLIKQVEWNLQTPRFKDVEKHATVSRDSKTVSRHKIPNVEIDLQNDLHRFAGLHCAQFRRHELVFNFTSTKEKQKDNTYALQIFFEDGKASLGKWVMPVSVDMNQMLAETPIDDLKNLTSFIKNCKHNIDCYVVRQEQFMSLKKHLSHMEHCVLQSNAGYTQIRLELYDVRDNEAEKYINLIISLMYHSDKARPHKIEVDTTGKNKLNDDLKRKLKKNLKEFKISALQTAFDKVLTEDNPAFTWIRIDDNDNSLDISDIDNLEEESLLAEIRSHRKEILKKNKRKRELQRKWNERKKLKAPLKSTVLEKEDEEEDEEENEEDSHSETKISRIKSPRQISVKKNKRIASTSRQEKKIDEDLIGQTTPLTKPKLKQTKLNFYRNQAIDSDGKDKSPIFHLKSHDKIKTAKLPMTSTPINFTANKIPSMSSLEIDNITHIESPRQDKLKINSKKNSRLKNLQNSNETNDSRKSKKLNDSRNSKKLDDSRNSKELDDSRNSKKLDDSRNSKELDDSRNSKELNDSRSSAILKIARRSDRLKNSKNSNKMDKSSSSNKLSSNNDTLNSLTKNTINKSAKNLKSNIRKSKNTSLKNRSLQNKSKILKSILYPNIPKTERNVKKRKKK